jgi:hypothetical protein
VQVSENVPELVNAPVDCVPLVAFVPSHAPEAAQLLASVDDQVRVELAPFAIVCGVAPIVTVGCGATVMVADCETLPPLPVQVSENVLVPVNGPVDCEPLIALAPDHAPEAVQLVALVDDQESAELAPLATICGFAPIVTVGGGGGGATVTVADCSTLPPAPVQVSENVLVLVNAPVDCVPLVAFTPDQAPEAAQLSALIDDQVSVALAPLAMLSGFTPKETVGAGGPDGGVGAGGVTADGAGGLSVVVVLTGSLPQPPSDNAARSANSQVLRICMDAIRPFIPLTPD